MSQSVERLDVGGGRRWLVLVFWLAVVAAVAFIGSSVTLPKIPTWYAGLAKPWFTPPNAVFGPAWTILYVMMAVAAWRIGLEAPKLGLAVIAALLVALAATLIAFWRIDRLAGLLLVPYLVWICYATALNAAIVALN